MPSSIPSLMPSGDFMPSSEPSSMPSSDPSSTESNAPSFIFDGPQITESVCCAGDGPSVVTEDEDQWKCAVELTFESDDVSTDDITIDGTVTTSLKKGVLGETKTSCRTESDGQCILYGKLIKTEQGGKPPKKPGIDYCIFTITSIIANDGLVIPIPSEFLDGYTITVQEVLDGLTT